MNVIKAPDSYPLDGYRVFLAGSIENGNAEKWQDEFTKLITNDKITILNPRRDRWIGDCTEKYENDQFRTQVEWELQALEDSDIVVLYFDPATKSPFSILELGLFKHKGIAVCCPDGFWKQGNIEIVCKRYEIPFTKDKELFFRKTSEFINNI